MTQTRNGVAELDSDVRSLAKACPDETHATSDSGDLHNGTVNTTNSSARQAPSSLSFNSRKPLFRCRESAFFTKLIRRLSKRRTVCNTCPPPPPSEQSNISEPAANYAQPSMATPASRRIRRWFSKHLLSQQPKADALPPKSIPDAVTRSSTAPRVAADAHDVYDKFKFPEGTAVRTVAAVEYGSVPTVRRGLPSGAPHFSESSLLTSSENAISQATPSFSTEALCSGGTPAPPLFDQPTDSLSRAHESLSSNNLGMNRQNSAESAVPTEPGASRYLSVSLAAFGYTGYSRKWVSAQALKVDKPDFLERFKSVSPPPSCSTANGLASRANRPQRLNLSLCPAPDAVHTHSQQPISSPTTRLPSSAPEESTTISKEDSACAVIAGSVFERHTEATNGHMEDSTSLHPRIESGDQSRVKLRLKRNLGYWSLNNPEKNYGMLNLLLSPTCFAILAVYPGRPVGENVICDPTQGTKDRQKPARRLTYPLSGPESVWHVLPALADEATVILGDQGTSSVADAEQERRSLIMLAVAHASPRSHSNSTSGGVLSPPHTPVARPTAPIALSPGYLEQYYVSVVVFYHLPLPSVSSSPAAPLFL
ncbi:unnamed protein product [Schistocephalus solidus]|uniref:UDENN domain-containing protein n=1 Tax=Schistocephalus solidus TaxID=70667 RepID=A0A183TBE6_SCHSO|nr:unnamed protein product [Schistocephalus solidus]